MYGGNAYLCCWRKAWPQQISSLHCTDMCLTVLPLNLLYTLIAPTSSQLHCLIEEIINTCSRWVMIITRRQHITFFVHFCKLSCKQHHRYFGRIYLICTGAKSILESYFLPVLVYWQCSGSLDSNSCAPWLKLYKAIYPNLVYLIRPGNRL